MRVMPIGLPMALVIAAGVLVGQVTEARITSTSAYFQVLRNIRVKYSNIGQVCEQVAKLDLENHYDRNLYTVTTNIEYGSRQRVVGELDVVIFDRLSGKAARIYEIKCWVNDARENRALKKARDQRKRFFEEINFGPGPEIWSKTRSYSVFQFRDLRTDQYKTGGPRGASDFDYQLPLNLQQLEQLARELMDCQRAGDCAQP